MNRDHSYPGAVPYRTPRAALVILAVAVFFVGATEFMLSSMFAPLAAAFDTSPVGASWLVSSYALSYALVAPVFGYFSDRMDRSRLLLYRLTVVRDRWTRNHSGTVP